MLSPEPMSTSPVRLTLPLMLALDGASVSPPPLTLPLTALPEPMDSEVEAAILPLTVTDEGLSVTVGAVTLPTSELPDASVNAVLAVTSPVRLTGDVVLMVPPATGPTMVTCEPRLTVPVAVSEPVILVVEPLPMLSVAAVTLAVMVCACAQIVNVPPLDSEPPLTARLDGLMSPIFRSPFDCSAALPLIVRPWL